MQRYQLEMKYYFLVWVIFNTIIGQMVKFQAKNKGAIMRPYDHQQNRVYLTISINSTSNTKTEFGVIGPEPCSP